MQHADRRTGLLPAPLEPPDESPGLSMELTIPDDRGSQSSDVLDNSMVRRIKELPKEVGVILISVGAVGFVLPGVMGAPAIIAGGLVLWPHTFGGLENWFRRRNPDLHRLGMQQIGRFLDDLERRYPRSPS